MAIFYSIDSIDDTLINTASENEIADENQPSLFDFYTDEELSWEHSAPVAEAGATAPEETKVAPAAGTKQTEKIL